MIMSFLGNLVLFGTFGSSVYLGFHQFEYIWVLYAMGVAVGGYLLNSLAAITHDGFRRGFHAMFNRLHLKILGLGIGLGYAYAMGQMAAEFGFTFA